MLKFNSVGSKKYIILDDGDIDEVSIHQGKMGLTIRLVTPIPLESEIEMEYNLPMRIPAITGGSGGKTALKRKVKYIRYTSKEHSGRRY